MKQKKINLSWWIPQIILILLLNYTGNIAQISPDSSGNFIVDKEEFKYIIKVNIEKNYNDSIVVAKNQEILMLRSTIKDQDSIQIIQDSQISELQRYATSLIKPFYDNFLFGAGVTFGLVTLLILLLKLNSGK